MTAAGVMMAADRTPESEALDEAHLGRMTLGDRSLEREVLAIFVRQAGLMLGRMAGAAPELTAAAAHTLKGSARGIGAWRVERAADRLEQAAGKNGGNHAIDRAVAELEAACGEASTVIRARLGRDRAAEFGADESEA